MLSNSVAAPIFTATTAEGVKPYGLFELFAAAWLIDLSAMAAHQREQRVTPKCNGRCGDSANLGGFWLVQRVANSHA